MPRNKVFTGALAGYLRGLLDEKRSLGFKYDEQERLMSALDEMSKQYDCSEGLPKELCLAFVERKPNWRQATQEGHVSLIRVLAEYMIRHDVPAYLIDSNIVTNRHEDFKPYIFTHKQMADIFSVADKIKPNSANSHIFYPTILRVQYGCGLRISETLGLHMKDVDFSSQVLHVINAKNNKDRDIPVSDSVIEYMKWYCRKIHPAYAPEDYFFKSRFGIGHYEKTAVNHYFRDILFDCGIKHGGKSDGGPHLHNLRHTFCVHSLEAMLRDGISHRTALPLLMTYMGHASLSATGRYLKLTAEAFPELVQQINRIYGEIMPGLEVKMEYEDDE
jgi:site-specific recombinase XerD